MSLKTGELPIILTSSPALHLPAARLRNPMSVVSSFVTCSRLADLQSLQLSIIVNVNEHPSLHTMAKLQKEANPQHTRIAAIICSSPPPSPQNSSPSRAIAPGTAKGITATTVGSCSGCCARAQAPSMAAELKPLELSHREPGTRACSRTAWAFAAKPSCRGCLREGGLGFGWLCRLVRS